MARARSVDNQRSRSKSALIEELTASIAKFQEILRTIEDCSQDGFPYRDAAQAKAELQLKERVRQTFGERSQEFQHCRTIKLRTDQQAGTEQNKAMIRGLMKTLEDRKLELQGLKPTPPPTAPPDATLSNIARLTLVSAATATTTGTTHVTPPLTVAVATTTNVSPSLAPIAPPVHQPATRIEHEHLVSSLQSPGSVPSDRLHTSSTITSSPVDPAGSSPSAPRKHSTVVEHTMSPVPAIEPTTSSSSPHPLPTPAPTAPLLPTPTHSPERPPVVESSHKSIPSIVPSATVAHLPLGASARPIVPTAPTTPLEQPSTPLPPEHEPLDLLGHSLAGARTTFESEPDHDPLPLIRKLYHRFHSVARQLRLRKDYRPTLDVEDDHDLQDLFCALLKLEFDEVATEEWTPPYTEGAPRSTLFVHKDHIAIITKKTRSGLTTKELADQVTTDAAHYREQGRCSTLMCFLYDPEGRIGSPKRLETTLTSVTEHYRVEVLVAPK